MSSFFLCFLCVCFLLPSDPYMVHTQTHKPDQTIINTNRFDMAKVAAQLLYGPVLVYLPLGTR